MNLSDVYLSTLEGLYKGTRLEQQELLGIYLDNFEGALWSQDLLDLTRSNKKPSELRSLPLRVCAVDPSVAAEPKDECGIVVVGSTADHLLYQRQAWVLEDASLLAPPETWAKAVVATARKWNAVVVAESNQGGELVANIIRTLDPTLRILSVHSKVGKALRAEPVVAAYDQQRVHHAGYFPLLESQMISWNPEETRKSPDRVDALTHGLTALLIRPPAGLWSSSSLYAQAATGKISGIGMKLHEKEIKGSGSRGSLGKSGGAVYRPSGGTNRKQNKGGPTKGGGWHVK
jgi:phage terminase large subunit-like protein